MGSRGDLGMGIQRRSRVGDPGKISGWGFREDLGMDPGRILGWDPGEIWGWGSRKDLRMGSRRDLGMGIQGRSQDGIKGRTENQLSSVYRPDKDQERRTANSSQFVLSTLFLCNESSFCYIQVNLLDSTTNYVLRTFSGISCPFYFNDRIIEIEYTHHKIPFLHGRSLFFWSHKIIQPSQLLD